MTKYVPSLANMGLLAGTVVVTLLVVELALPWIIPLRDVGPSFSRHHPQLGQHLKPNFTTVRKTPEFTMRLSTNAFGFRGAGIDSLPKSAILFLGDSFTMGYGVNDGQEYPAIIRSRLKQELHDAAPPVINAGIGSSGNGRWIKILSTIAPEVGPRLVVMQVLENDFDDNQNERLFAMGNNGELLELPVPQPGFPRRLQSAIEAVPGLAGSNLIALLRQIRPAALLQWGSRPAVQADDRKSLRSGDALTLRILERAVSMCLKRGWNALGLIVGIEGERGEAVRSIFGKHGVTAISLPSKAKRPDLYFKVDGHWNAAGHSFAADSLMGHLR